MTQALVWRYVFPTLAHEIGETDKTALGGNRTMTIIKPALAAAAIVFAAAPALSHHKANAQYDTAHEV